MTPALPLNETQRLERLVNYGVLDTAPEPLFDDLTTLASSICGTPIAAISLLDSKRQWFKSIHGLAVSETPRDIAFCGHAILTPEVFVVEDAQLDGRFSDNPLVTGDPHVRFYAGAPLIEPSGCTLGTLCVIDRVPRTLSPHQAEALRVLSRQVITQLEMRRAMKELAAAELQTREIAERFRAVSDTANDAIISTDSDGRITYVNRSVERIFGYASHELLGSPLKLLMPARYHEDHTVGLARLSATGKPVIAGRTVELFGLRRDGTEFPLELSLSANKLESGVFFTGVIRDITDRRHDQAQLEAANSALERRVAERTRELTAANAALAGAQQKLEAGVRDRTAQLENEKLFIQAVLDNIVDGIVACDAEGNLRLFNRATTEMHGMAGEESLPPENWAERYHLYRADGVTPMSSSDVPLRRAFLGEQVRDEELVIAPAGKPRRRVLSSGRAFFDAYGRKLGAVVGMHDITERAAAEEKFRVLFECSSDAHLLFDENGIIDCNNATTAMLRCDSKSQLLSLHPARLSPEFQPDGRRSSEKCLEMDAIALRRGVHRFEWVHQKMDGTAFPVDVTVTPVQLNGKQVMLVVWHDLTERNGVQERLREAKEAAEKATRSKSEFLANMSHEIRTPMTAILGYAGLLADPKLPAEARTAHVQVIQRNGQHLLSVINDILDISKIDAGKMSVECVPCSPGQIVAEVESLMRVRASEKGIGFGVEYRGSMPAAVLSDPTRLRQVLLNLVGNAIKFTVAGGVSIACSAERREGGVQLRFDVTDTGIGLTPEQQRNLFRPFGQADNSTTRRFGGTGLGLAICHRLVDMLGGTISVVSHLHGGSTFSFAVSAAEPPAGTQPLPGPGAVEAAPPAARKLAGRVLLAEDGADNRRLITLYLEEAGLQVEIAPNGRIAVDKVTAAGAGPRAFDLVLMDMQMPELDGYDATRELRRRGFAALPIVALTAHAMAGDREQCLQAGCNDYATKPVDQAILITTIGRYLTRLSPAAAREVPTPIPSQTSTGALRSSRADDPVLQRVLKEYIADLPAHVADLEATLADLDLASLKTRVHQLRGSGGGYGFADITRLATAAEASIAGGAAVGKLSADVTALIDLIRSVEGYDPARECRQADAHD